MSHLEIYNEVIRDLLNPENTNLKIHESADGNVFVGKLTECNVRLVSGISSLDLQLTVDRCRSPAEVMTLLLQGQGREHFSRIPVSVNRIHSKPTNGCYANERRKFPFTFDLSFGD